MGKQYISTAVKGLAHESDIYSIAITRKFTVSIAADGNIKLWSNANSDPTLFEPVLSHKVNNVGLHHLSTFDSMIENQLVTLIACVSFSGEMYIFRVNYSDLSLELVDFTNKDKARFWALKFCENLESASDHRLVVTRVDGSASVFNVTVQDNSISISLHGKIQQPGSNSLSFPTCVDVDSATKQFAVGYENGDCGLFDLETLKPIYQFESPGLKQSSSTMTRCVKYSPAGNGVIAVSRDSGSYGTITLYDATYGETLGTLTNASHSSNVGIGGFAHEGWCLSLDFNQDGTFLASAGYDNKIRVWNIETREKDSTITLSSSDVADEEMSDQAQDQNVLVTTVIFIAKGTRQGDGDSTNEGLACCGFDRTIRWYREAGGI